MVESTIAFNTLGLKWEGPGPGKVRCGGIKDRMLMSDLYALGKNKWISIRLTVQMVNSTLLRYQQQGEFFAVPDHITLVT